MTGGFVSGLWSENRGSNINLEMYKEYIPLCDFSWFSSEQYFSLLAAWTQPEHSMCDCVYCVLSAVTLKTQRICEK